MRKRFFLVPGPVRTQRRSIDLPNPIAIALCQTRMLLREDPPPEAMTGATPGYGSFTVDHIMAAR